jgi:hypothetical protein
MSAFGDANNQRQKLLAQIRQTATEQRKSAQQLATEFIRNRRSGIYNYLFEIPELNIFYYFIIFFIVFFFLKSYNFVYQDIVIIIVGFLVLFIINEGRRTLTISKNNELKIKLLGIFPKPKFFYMDSGIIELIHSIKEMKQYNIGAFNNLVSILDNFLHTINDIEKNSDLAFELYDNLVDFKKAALNNLQSIIHTAPTVLVVENKLSDAVDSLQIILNYYLETVRNISKEKTNKTLNVNSKFHQSIENPSGHDPNSNDKFDLF